MKEPILIVSCEHGGNDVPENYRPLFDSPGARADLRSHRGYDPGSLLAAKFCAEQFRAPLIFSTVTRLLVDLNRSSDNPELFSKYSDRLDPVSKHQLLAEQYTPFRQQVFGLVRDGIQSKDRVIHLSIHTFTPRLRGTRRAVDIGLLFDPDREHETLICRPWCEAIRNRLPRVRVRLNEPYPGIADGLTTWLRTRFADWQYAGIEVEISNTLAKKSTASQNYLLRSLVETIRY